MAIETGASNESGPEKVEQHVPAPQVQAARVQPVNAVPRPAPTPAPNATRAAALPEDPKARLDARIQSRFNISVTDYRLIGQDRDRIVEHLEKNAHVDPRDARKQVDAFFDEEGNA